MSTMAKNDPIPVDDQCPFFRQVVDSSSVLLHTARPDGYLEFFDQTWLDFACMPLENLLGCGWPSCIHPEDVEALMQKMREFLCPGKTPSGNIKSAKSQWCLAGFRNRLREVGLG